MKRISFFKSKFLNIVFGVLVVTVGACLLVCHVQNKNFDKSKQKVFTTEETSDEELSISNLISVEPVTLCRVVDGDTANYFLNYDKDYEDNYGLSYLLLVNFYNVDITKQQHTTQKMFKVILLDGEDINTIKTIPNVKYAVFFEKIKNNFQL